MRRARVGRPAEHVGAANCRRGHRFGRNALARQFPAKAKHNIVLFMPGGPSQLDLFDPKPALEKYAGQRPPTPSTCAPSAPPAACCRRRSASKSTASAGIEISELLPNLAAIDRRPLRRPLDVHLQSHPHARRAACFIPATSPPRGRRWAPGSPTAWAPKTKTCPASSCSAPAGGGGSARAVASCRRSTRAVGSTIRSPSRKG